MIVGFCDCTSVSKCRLFIRILSYAHVLVFNCFTSFLSLYNIWTIHMWKCWLINAICVQVNKKSVTFREGYKGNICGMHVQYLFFFNFISLNQSLKRRHHVSHLNLKRYHCAGRRLLVLLSKSSTVIRWDKLNSFFFSPQNTTNSKSVQLLYDLQIICHIIERFLCLSSD